MYCIMAHSYNSIMFPVYFSEDKEKLEGLLDQFGTFDDQYKNINKEGSPIESILTRYYNGCGEITGLSVEEVIEDKPWLEWDLD